MPFGGRVKIAPNLGGQIPQKHPFWGREKAFSSHTREIEKHAYLLEPKTDKKVYSFLRRSAHVGFYSSDSSIFDDLCIQADQSLFNSLT